MTEAMTDASTRHRESDALKVLVFPAEEYPCHHSFLEEVFTRTPDDLCAHFLMRTRAVGPARPATWNEATVETLSMVPSSSILRWIRSYATDLRIVPRLWRTLRHESPDVVFVRDMTFPFLVALLLRPWSDYAVVFQKSFPNEMRWFDRAWVNAHKLPWLWTACRHVENHVLHRALRHADAILPISPLMGQELIERWDLPKERVHPFGLGIDPGDTAGPSSRDHGAVRLVYVGTLAATRRIDVMVRAFARASKALGPDRTSLTILGGSDDEVAKLRSLVIELGVDDVVELTGRVPRETVYRQLSEHDAGAVFIAHDPRFWVASPTKLIESLAFGLPVVATAACALNRDLADSTGAVIVTDDSEEDFARGIVELVENFDTLAANAASARPRILREYDYAEIRRDVVSVLRGAVARRRGKTSGSSK